MSSTNKTTYYDLSQYIGTDKPTYLGDYNSDMAKIDAGIHGAEDKATTASQNAGSAIARVGEVEKTVKEHTQSITLLQGQMTQVTDIANTANTKAIDAGKKASDAQSTANNALLTANNAKAGVDSANWITRDVNANVGDVDKQITISYNPLLKILNFYGNVSFNVKTNLSLNDLLFTIPSDIMSMIGLTGERTIYAIESTAYDVTIAGTTFANPRMTNVKIRPSGEVLQGVNNNGTQFIAFNCMLNTSTWS